MMASEVSSRLTTTLRELLAQRGLEDVAVQAEGAQGGAVGVVAKAAARDRSGCLYSLVIKAPPSGICSRKYLAITSMMRREIFFYEHIVPAYERLQASLRLLEHVAFDFPKCYLSADEYSKEVLVLEDLGSRGLVLADASEPLDYAHGSLAVRTLAKFHALSLIFQNKEPQTFDGFTKVLTDNMFENCEDYDASGVRRFARQAFDKFVGAVRDEEHRLRLSQRRAGFVDDLRTLFGSGDVKVISHGDYWINNIMFKYRDKTPFHAVVIDYQTLRYSSLTNDLLSFMGTCFQRDLRRHHFSDLLRDYYSSLQETLAAAAPHHHHRSLCTWDDFQRELYKQSFFCLAAGIFFIQFFDTNVLDIQVLYSGNLPPAFSEPSPRFIELANDLVEDYISWGFEL